MRNLQNSLDTSPASRANASSRGAWRSLFGGSMPSYEICYLNDDGTLACTLAAMCSDEMRAKALAQAMKLSEYKRFEVWEDRTLVYERPQLFGVAEIARL